MKINIEKLSEAVNNPNLPSFTIPSSETIAMMANYSNATSDMVYYMQKFLDSVDAVKSKIVLMRCPCLAATMNEAMRFDPISAANKGNIITLPGSDWDGTTRRLVSTRIDNWFNDNYISSGATINNLSLMLISSTTPTPITMSEPVRWSGIGWSTYVENSPRGQWNNLENNIVYAYLYSGAHFSHKDSNSTYLAKDSSVRVWFDWASTSGCIIIMQGATIDEYETVMAAAKELVDNINNCWE